MRAGLLLLGLPWIVACGAAPAPPTPKAAPVGEPAPTTSASASTSSAPADGAAQHVADAGAATPHEKPTKISARHVLIQWMGSQQAGSSVVRTREQALKVAEDVLRRARAGEDFARLAVEFSDEPNAGARGGSLGRFGHGQMVKQFEDAAFALAPGEISGIVESPFGFHIIQRTE